MIRVAIADDHTMLREGLKQLLAAAADIAVIGEAGNGLEVLQLIRNGDIDVLLLDMSMPGRSGIELIKQVRDESPKLRILVLSRHGEQQYAVRAIKAGAAGYITKESAAADLVSAIRKVAGGGAFISSTVAEQLALNAMPNADGPPHTTLSDREYQIFKMMVEGAGVSDIAARLSLSVKTVSTHKTHIMQKMSMTNQSELIRYAINYCLLDDPESRH